ncbi:hypothetical protein EDD68_107114 [Melghiribacillus thermohalophilus]|uniref:Uncharacterized protein n=1 Tax=Melghiribacillus thermohalophilus TaxID=1324956 RepID=A0A4R3N2R6_9BACI|nr:hypothetical protein [Melghiribacillus thermohalophilus]TCT23400.1 hypothetical protein EDD68_107114 [Melghiribacillus thermohalophilus]
MSEQKQWYTNKQLFEQILSIQNDLKDFQIELKETRAMIKKYNGLREEVGALREEVKAIENKQKGKKEISRSVLNWGGFIFGMLTVVITAIAKLM